MQHLLLLIVSGCDIHDCADAVAVRLCSHQLQAQAAIRPALIMEKESWAGVGGDQNIEEAVVVDIGKSRTPRHSGRCKGWSHLRRHLLKLASAEVAKKMRRLGVAHALLDTLD